MRQAMRQQMALPEPDPEDGWGDWYDLAEEGASEQECAELGYPLRVRRERKREGAGR